jgi:hypothetical protein
MPKALFDKIIVTQPEISGKRGNLLAKHIHDPRNGVALHAPRHTLESDTVRKKMTPRPFHHHILV